jgi:hypothetical protein
MRKRTMIIRRTSQVISRMREYKAAKGMGWLHHAGRLEYRLEEQDERIAFCYQTLPRRLQDLQERKQQTGASPKRKAKRIQAMQDLVDESRKARNRERTPIQRRISIFDHYLISWLLISIVSPPLQLWYTSLISPVVFCGIK